MLTDTRLVYRPFKYPFAHEYFMKQQQAHWLWTEVNMASDIKDFNENLTSHEREVITRILQLFTNTEIIVGEYWSQSVAKWFPQPEIQQMALTFSSFEMIHISAYDHLNTSLGLSDEEHSKFLSIPELAARQDKLSKVLSDTDSLKKKAVALAVFSGFCEGVQLFSSFAALMNFSRFNKMKSIAQITSWSSKDESLHSEAGCALFRTLIEENREMFDDELKQAVYQSARDIVALEDAYIDYVFNDKAIQGLDPRDLKAYIRFRANTKLNDLGLKSNWKNLDQERVKNITSWYDMLVNGNEHTDFFSQRPTSYSKGHIDWNSVDFTKRGF
jgi:ribonucleoside-diphosphate reductase beta chain